MADKPEPSNENGHTIAFQIIAIVVVLLIISGYVTKLGLDKYYEGAKNTLNEGGVTGKSFAAKIRLGLSDLFSGGKIELGKEAANKKDTTVYTEPAGQVLGEQNIGEVGKILEGPTEKLGVVWYDLDYKNAPDGWVRSTDISANSSWVSFISFFPWFFSGFKKVAILLGILVAILIGIIYMKKLSIGKVAGKKMELKKEMTLMEKISEQKKRGSTNGGFNNSIEELILPIAGLPIGEPPELENVSDRRWKNIQHLITSYNASDWKQAIIEADIILDEMLDKMGYHGDSIGDKLKQVEPSDFLTINQAWEAHKIRNQIAHKGSNYILSKDEAERVIKMFGEVFKEFYYI